MNARVILAGSFSVEPLVATLKFLLGYAGIEVEVDLAEGIASPVQLLAWAGTFSNDERDTNVLFLRVSDWFGQPRFPTAPSLDPRTVAAEIAASVESAIARSGAPFLLCFAPSNPSDAAEAIGAVERAVAERLARTPLVHVVTSEEVLATYPMSDYYDGSADAAALVPFSGDLYAALAMITARRLYAERAAPYKVVVADCDGTLWDGVCGEDGPEGVSVGADRVELQRFLLDCRNRGMLLAVCSKNADADVRAVFACQHHMPLEPQHVSAWRVNWDDKSDSLRALSAELGVGLDSFVLVDDSAAERAEVRARCPEVLVVDLPSDPRAAVSVLRRHWAFDQPRATPDARPRAELYRDHAAREDVRSRTRSLDELLADLQLVLDVLPIDAERMIRVASLSRRTNQFNASVVRRTQAEVAEFLAGDGADGFVVQARDRFGDYGVVGVVLYAIRDATLDVDTFLLSCRALGRRIESRMLDEIVARARRGCATFVRVRYVPTPRNQPARAFLAAVPGATPVDEAGATVFRFGVGAS